jgi:hypothetical protein
LEECLRRGRVGIRQATGEFQVRRERDQMLLRTIVKVALDRAPVGIGGQDEALPGRA